MEQKNSKASPAIDIRSFVRKYINSIPSHEFDALLNQISYLDHYKSIDLKKAFVHHLDEVVTKAISFYKPEILYKNSFDLEECIVKVDLVDFGYECLYRSKLIYPNKKFRLMLNVFGKRTEAEEFLVESLSDFV